MISEPLGVDTLDDFSFSSSLSFSLVSLFSFPTLACYHWHWVRVALGAAGPSLITRWGIAILHATSRSFQRDGKLCTWWCIWNAWGGLIGTTTWFTRLLLRNLAHHGLVTIVDDIDLDMTLLLSHEPSDPQTKPCLKLPCETEREEALTLRSTWLECPFDPPLVLYPQGIISVVHDYWPLSGWPL